MRQKFFSMLANFIVKHPFKVLAAAILLTIVSSVYAATTIKLNANLDELVSDKLDYHRRYIDFLKEFGDEEYLYVVVDASKDILESKKFMEVLGEKIKKLPDIKQVMWKIDNPVLERNFLLYMTPDQLKVLSKMTTEGPFSVKNIASWDGFAPMFGALAARIGGTVSTEDEKELSTGFTFIDGLLDDMISSVEKGVPYTSRLQALFFGDGETFDPDGFLKNGSLLFMFIMPDKDFSTMAVIEKPLKNIRRIIDETKRDFPGLDAGLTGRPVLSADEMATSNHDMTLATFIALALVAIILIVAFRGIGRPLCAVATLVMGISWTFGFIAVTFGTLNILSSVFALLLIGASIEYSIYIVSRYEEELGKKGDVNSAIKVALTTTGMADVTSAITTAAAFCTLLWTDFTALSQLGLISGMGIMLCLIAMLVVLPAMLVIRDRKRNVAKLKSIRSFNLPQMAIIYRRPGVLIVASVILMIAIAPFASRIGFDNNLLNLQAKGLDSVKYEHLIIEKSKETTWFARSVADTIDESHRKASELRALPSVRAVDDVEKILPENQKEKSVTVKRMAPSFDGLSFNKVGDNLNSKMLMFDLGRLASNLEHLESQAFSSGRTDAVEELDAFATKIRKLVSIIDSADDGQLKNLSLMQKSFFADLQKNISLLSLGMHPTAIALKDLPGDVVSRFVSPKGRYTLYIYPKENIWDPDALARFVSDIRGVDMDVVGTPIEVHESGKLMRNTFSKSAGLAFLVICLIVWLDFKSFRASILAILPLMCGMLWLFGTMGILGLQFNMANFFAIPILIGTGVDFGVQVVHRLRQEKGFVALSTSTGKGLLLTAIANGVGFGTMMIAHHRGIASLGAILAMGCVYCLVASLIVTPPVAKWLNWGHKGKSKGER